MFKNLKKKTKEDFNWKERSKIKFVLGAPVSILP